MEPVASEKDIELLFNLITRHRELTGSQQAGWILANWEDTLPRFVKVFPYEYKRVLGLPRTSPAAAHAGQKAVHG